MRDHQVREILQLIKDILRRLDTIVCQLAGDASPSAQGGFTYSVGPVGPKESSLMPLDVSIDTTQKVRVAANPVTASGKAAKVDGPVTFTVATGDVTIAPSDATSVFLVSGANGDSTVTVSADADLGPGVTTITDTITLHVTDGQATALGLVADKPIAK